MKSKGEYAQSFTQPYERYGILWPKFGLHWFAEEAVEVEVVEPEVPQSFSVDDIILDEEKEDKKQDEELEVEVEGKEKISTEKNEVAELKKQIQELQSDLLKVSSKREVVVPKPDEAKKEKLTKAQLVQILKEHKDDPEVLLNVAEYIAEQKAEETRDATMKDVNHRQWHSNLSGMANRILVEDQDGYLAANPKVGQQLDEYANNLGMGDHPVGKLAAYAILRLSELSKAKGDEDVKSPSPKEIIDPNKGKMDKTRLTGLKNKSSGLTQDQLNMAKKFGVKPETYAKFVGRS